MHYLVSGDTGSILQVEIVRQDTGEVVDLTDVTVTLKFRKRGTTIILFSILGISFTAEQATSGVSMLQFGDNLVGLAKGQYEGELSIATETLSEEIVYEILYFQVRDSF